MIAIINANALAVPLADKSVHCVVTSPPYWSLRDYGIGDAQLGLEPLHDCLAWTRNEPPCGACFVCQMRRVFAEVWRVLRDDGTVWINLGDSFDSKQLVGIPWRVALALQSDGWYLRSDIIWAKPNPMPESVTDRPTKAHEYVFLLAKSARYFYDADAVREDSSGLSGGGFGPSSPHGTLRNDIGRPRSPDSGKRNRRTVWTIATQPYSGAHFATFPPKLVEPCIRAGCPVGGTVLDPFGGSGTTAVVAERLGRNSVILDLSPDYLQLARQRTQLDALQALQTGAGIDSGREDYGDLPLFVTGQES